LDSLQDLWGLLPCQRIFSLSRILIEIEWWGKKYRSLQIEEGELKSRGITPERSIYAINKNPIRFLRLVVDASHIALLWMMACVLIEHFFSLPSACLFLYAALGVFIVVFRRVMMRGRIKSSDLPPLDPALMRIESITSEFQVKTTNDTRSTDLLDLDSPDWYLGYEAVERSVDARVKEGHRLINLALLRQRWALKIQDDLAIVSAQGTIQQTLEPAVRFIPIFNTKPRILVAADQVAETFHGLINPAVLVRRNSYVIVRMRGINFVLPLKRPHVKVKFIMELLKRVGFIFPEDAKWLLVDDMLDYEDSVYPGQVIKVKGVSVPQAALLAGGRTVIGDKEIQKEADLHQLELHPYIRLLHILKLNQVWISRKNIMRWSLAIVTFSIAILYFKAEWLRSHANPTPHSFLLQKSLILNAA
jgi:hypothetical protein